MFYGIVHLFIVYGIVHLLCYRVSVFPGMVLFPRMLKAEEGEARGSRLNKPKSEGEEVNKRTGE